MEDSEVIEAFVEQGSGSVFGPSLNLERGTLKLDGWWSVAYRVSPRTFILRDDPAPTDSSAQADVAAALTARGLTAVGMDLPAIAMLTYTNIDLGYAPWMVWSTDLETGEADLNARATEEAFLEGGPATDPGAQPDNADHVRGGRRLAGGTETRVVLALGVGEPATTGLADHLEDCRVESRGLDEIAPEDCGSLLPTLVLVDATEAEGSAFVAELRALGALSVPVVAVTDGGEMRPGADATIDAADPPEAWAPLIRDLLR